MEFPSRENFPQRQSVDHAAESICREAWWSFPSVEYQTRYTSPCDQPPADILHALRLLFAIRPHGAGLSFAAANIAIPIVAGRVDFNGCRARFSGHRLVDELDGRRITLRGRARAGTAGGVQFLLHRGQGSTPFDHRGMPPPFVPFFLEVAAKGTSYAAPWCSMATSASRLWMSRKIDATASVRPLRLNRRRQSLAAMSPSISTASHCSAWPT